MKKYLPVLLLAALSACGGQPAENVEQPPKPLSLDHIYAQLHR